MDNNTYSNFQFNSIFYLLIQCESIVVKNRINRYNTVDINQGTYLSIVSSFKDRAVLLTLQRVRRKEIEREIGIVPFT